MCAGMCVYRCLYVHVGACACMYVTCVWTWTCICVCCICYVWMCLHVWVALNINLHPHERANVEHWSIKEKNMGNPNAENHKRDNMTCINPPPPIKRQIPEPAQSLFPKDLRPKNQTSLFSSYRYLWSLHVMLLIHLPTQLYSLITHREIS